MIKLNSRYLLHNYINTNRIFNVAEIGVGFGCYACYILESCPQIEHYYGIENFGGKFMKGSMSLQRKRVEERMDEYKRRFIWKIGDSVSMSEQFEDGSLDLIYIDGDHSFNGVYGDLRAWYPKLRPGGVLSGHDYTPLRRDGVRKGWNKFLPEVGLSVNNAYITKDVQIHPSIFIIKL